MYIVLYVFAAAAIAGAVGLSYLGMDAGAVAGMDALKAGVRDNGLLLVGGLILAGLGRVLQHMEGIDAGLNRVAEAAEEAARLDG
ncbi:MAG: hypothetical protein IIC53_11725 [Proteobacteria bacterium]|nr:hypothetical protein [Pseudomonadota bacterium]